MIRENKYLVIKNADIEKYLNDGQQLKLNMFVTKIRIERLNDGKQDQSYVVVAADWPMYEMVWGMIEAFVDGKPSEIESIKQQLAECQATNGRLRNIVPAFRPQYGAVGSRDVDVAKQIAAYDETLALPNDATALNELIAERTAWSVASVVKHHVNNQKWRSHKMSEFTEAVNQWRDGHPANNAIFAAEREIESLRQQLAECQATNGKLREAFTKIATNSFRSIQDVFNVAHDALALPNDATALNELRQQNAELAAEVERLSEDVSHWRHQSDEAGMLRVRYGARIDELTAEVERLKVAAEFDETIERLREQSVDELTAQRDALQKKSK